MRSGIAAGGVPSGRLSSGRLALLAAGLGCWASTGLVCRGLIGLVSCIGVGLAGFTTAGGFWALRRLPRFRRSLHLSSLFLILRIIILVKKFFFIPPWALGRIITGFGLGLSGTMGLMD